MSLDFLALTFAFSYVLGLVPALVAASVVRYLQRRNLRHEGLAVGLTGVAVGLSYVAMLAWIAGESVLRVKTAMLLGHVATCLVPTWVCRHLSWRLGKTAPVRS